MDSNEIGKLLEKYWNCETSLEEEKILRDYFNGGVVPENMSDAAGVFKYFEGERQRSLSTSFDSEISKNLKKEVKAGKVVSMVRWVQIARIAAGVLVVVAATYFVRNEVRKSYAADTVDTYNDPALALEETKKALLLISRGFGKAKEKAGKINMFNEAEKKIQGKGKDEEKEKVNI